ncbi:DUF1845 domain-containing protein [Piscinibacter sakaiensis]|uniref:DUF1845 domain-containing protein n=1 Tax=Piscinibacter sakaiensis TaxID=1547922 RepID=UPI003AB017FA
MADDDAPQLIIRLDEGGVNVRILKRQIQADYRRVESASVKLHVRFGSPEGKRLFVRSFHSFQLLTHFILTIGRINLDDGRIKPVEDLIRAAVDRVSHHLDLEMDKAEELFKAHGVTQLASFDTKPLELRVPVLSSLTRRYLEAISKLDHYMDVLQTLEFYDIWTASEIDQQRAALKRELREVVRDTRALAADLRREMDDSKQTAAQESAPDHPDAGLIELAPAAPPSAADPVDPVPQAREAEQA